MCVSKHALEHNETMEKKKDEHNKWKIKNVKTFSLLLLIIIIIIIFFFNFRKD